MANENRQAENLEDSRREKEWRTQMKEHFEAIIWESATDEESVEDILSGAYALGKCRADLHSRIFEPHRDVVFALCIFCWWPFKPAVMEDTKQKLHILRLKLFKDVNSDTEAMDNLINSVSDRLLEFCTHELYEILQEEPEYIYENLSKDSDPWL